MSEKQLIDEALLQRTLVTTGCGRGLDARLWELERLSIAEHLAAVVLYSGGEEDPAVRAEKYRAAKEARETAAHALHQILQALDRVADRNPAAAGRRGW